MQHADHILRRGFTLIELSIVLVIIGLIVGGVLVGQSVINAAKVRATVTQIERFNTAVNTFRGKYGFLPGDIKDPDATSFGFTPRGQYAGEGDGNGIIEGVTSNGAGQNGGYYEGAGETAMFWVDLTTANGQNVNFIDGSFSGASVSVNGSNGVTLSTSPNLNSFLPTAKVGNANYFYVYSQNGANYFGLSSVTVISSVGWVTSTAGLTVAQAYSIDKKIDDGLPQTGDVTAKMLAGGPTWAPYPPGGAMPYQTATGSASTCYDDNGSSGNPMQYSVEISGGSNVNCALSFKMQAGD